MIELRKFFGICTATGEEVEICKWLIVINGITVGYLPKVQDSEIQPLDNFPFDNTEEVCKELELQRHLMTGVPSKVKPPEAANEQYLRAMRKAILEQRESEDDEDGDE